MTDLKTFFLMTFFVSQSASPGITPFLLCKKTNNRFFDEGLVVVFEGSKASQQSVTLLGPSPNPLSNRARKEEMISVFLCLLA